MAESIKQLLFSHFDFTKVGNQFDVTVKDNDDNLKLLVTQLFDCHISFKKNGDVLSFVIEETKDLQLKVDNNGTLLNLILSQFEKTKENYGISNCSILRGKEVIIFNIMYMSYKIKLRSVKDGHLIEIECYNDKFLHFEMKFNDYEEIVKSIKSIVDQILVYFVMKSRHHILYTNMLYKYNFMPYNLSKKFYVKPQLTQCSDDRWYLQYNAETKIYTTKELLENVDNLRNIVGV